MNYSELIAKPEVRRAGVEIQRVLSSARPAGSFGEREAAALAAKLYNLPVVTPATRRRL